jgi:16S rRNA (guanine1207-N2)-methyltransferase
MSAETVATLLLPFEKGVLPRPGPRRALFLRAEFAPGIDAAWREALVVEQTWRPAFDPWQRLGVPSLADIGREHDENVFDLVLVQLTKDRQESFGLIERGWRKLVPGGTLVAAGPKDQGAVAVERLLASLHPLVGHLPKHGCRVFWLKKTQTKPAFETALQEWRARFLPRVLVADRFVSRPGLFSWDRIDRGSAFLVEHLPKTISGNVADFGCGWGFVAASLLDRCDGIETLACLDAERTALDCAKENLSGARVPVAYHWADLTKPLTGMKAFDWIVSNPPFHDGALGDPCIGQKFIATAKAALASSGQLVLVANRHLPYERALREGFGTFEFLAEGRSFKVLATQRA